MTVRQYDQLSQQQLGFLCCISCISVVLETWSVVVVCEWRCSQRCVPSRRQRWRYGVLGLRGRTTGGSHVLLALSLPSRWRLPQTTAHHLASGTYKPMDSRSGTQNEDAKTECSLCMETTLVLIISFDPWLKIEELLKKIITDFLSVHWHILCIVTKLWRRSLKSLSKSRLCTEYL